MNVIIDTSYFCYRSMFGMTSLSYQNKKVHIVFDFLRQVLILAEKYRPADFFFCFDSKNSYRKLVYPDYKENRNNGKEKTEEEKQDLVDTLRQREDLKTKVLPYMGFKNIFQQSGYESDDIIAEIILKKPNEEFVIAARDEDLFQLLSDKVKLFDLKKEYSKEDFTKQYFDLEPNKWAEVKAWAGCNSDNVKGIEKVGNITAAKYLTGNLKPGKIKERIETKDAKRIYDRNLKLVSLPYKDGIKPLNIELKEDEIDLDMFQSIFKQYGFNYFSDKMWDRWVAAFLF